MSDHYLTIRVLVRSDHYLTKKGPGQVRSPSHNKKGPVRV